jgi:hypothetical protein
VRAEATPSRRRLVALAGLWLAVSGAVLLAPGCYGRNCEGDVLTFGAEMGQGRMVNDTTWESNNQTERWIPFPAQRYYVFDIRALGGRTPDIILPYLSAQEEPAKGGNFTLGGGNLTLLTNASPNRIDVKNDSCSDYFLRLVVSVPPLPPPTTADASIGLADASVSDAATRSNDAGDAEAGP